MKKSVDSNQPLFNLASKPLLVVLSGPSGVGKDVVLNQMKESGYPLKYITTLTTRPQRPREKNNVDYHFVSKEKFQEMIDNNGFLERAEVYGNWYGVPREEVKKALDNGKDVMVKVDVQGAATIKKTLPQAVLIFLMPPSIEQLLMRLKKRHTESAADLDLRLKTAQKEIDQLSIFDYIVVNRLDKIELAVSEIKAIITAEKCRVNPRQITL